MSQFDLPPVSIINRPAIPVGTIAEAEAEGLDPTVYSTCSKPNPVSGVKGCPWFGKCRVSAKGKSGPANYGIQIIKGASQGGGMVNTAVNCMWIADHVDDIERNGGSVKFIAEEGQTFEKLTRIAVSNVDGKIATNQWDKNVHREDRRVPIEVPKWPRPGENRELLQDLMRAEAAQIEMERRSDDNLARNLGLEHTIPPIDKRNAAGGGSAEGRSAKGSGKSAG